MGGSVGLDLEFVEVGTRSGKAGLGYGEVGPGYRVGGYDQMVLLYVTQTRMPKAGMSFL